MNEIKIMHIVYPLQCVHSFIKGYVISLGFIQLLEQKHDSVFNASMDNKLMIIYLNKLPTKEMQNCYE